jgi:hypothetical protein
VCAGHQEIDLNQLAALIKPLCAREPQFDCVWKTRGGDAHAVLRLGKYHGFNDDRDGVLISESDKNIHLWSPSPWR